MVVIQLKGIEDEAKQEEMRARVLTSDVYVTLNDIFSDLVGMDIDDCDQTLYAKGPNGVQFVQYITEKKEVQYMAAFKMNEEQVHGDLEISPNEAQAPG